MNFMKLDVTEDKRNLFNFSLNSRYVVAYKSKKDELIDIIFF